MGKKKKQRRAGTRAGRAETRPPDPGWMRAKAPGDFVPALVAAKLRMTRLMRALDVVGADPRDHEGVPEALTDCTQLDMMCTPMLAFCDSEEAFEEPEFAETTRALLGTVEEAVEKVFRALPTAVGEELRIALDQVGASEHEVWMEVEGFTADAMDDADADPDTELTIEDLRDDRDLILQAFTDGAPEQAADERVAREERRKLPRSPEPNVWLQRLPKPWLQTIARMYGCSRNGTKAKIARRVEKAQLDPDRLGAAIGEGLGDRDRELLAMLVGVAGMPLEMLPEEMGLELEVPWDWSRALPFTCGGKLRAFGLVYVGTRRGLPTIDLPLGLVSTLVGVLRTGHPEEWASWDSDLLRELENVEARALDAGQRLPADDDDPPRLRLVRGGRTKERKRPDRTFVLDVELRDSVPPITRRVRVSGRRTLGELHVVLQDVMGWDDAHLHEFEARDGSWHYADLRHDLEGKDDENNVTLADVAPRVGSRFLYVYDFGDDWVHEVRVAERLEPAKAGPEPRCLGGRNACPPEDSGGVWGYAMKLEVLQDPDHADYVDVLEWMGDDFDPTHFDLEEVNRRFGA